MSKLFCMLAAAILLSGCGGLFGVNLFFVDQKTALEQQVLGTYESIGEDLAAFASVRGVEPDGSMKEAPQITDSQRETVRAMNNRRYNRADVESILAEGIVGEGNDGLLATREEVRAVGELETALVSTLIDEENNDRKRIVERLVQTTPGVRESDRAEVAYIFASVNRDLAPRGAYIQERDGTWSTKP